MEITIRFFKFVWEILPIQPTIQTRKKISTSLFLEDENIFQKSAPLVVGGLAVLRYNYNRRYRFLKNVLIFEKEGGC
jgi:hypothetical protein